MRTAEEEAFDHWWSRNHPHDWFARHRGGDPISTHERLLIWELCRDAYLRGPGSYNTPERRSDQVTAG